MVFNRTSLAHHKRRTRGVTLVEYMFATSIGVLVLAAALLLWGYASRTCALLYSYIELSSTSKNALDNISQQIRNARTVQSCSSTQLVLLIPSDVTTNTATVTFAFDAGNQTLRQTKSELSQPTTSKVLLTRCTNFQFLVFQRTPISNSFGLYTNGWSTNTAKVVQMQWRCIRPLRGDQDVLEDQVSANVVIRSQ